jgi:hypothetical protein
MEKKHVSEKKNLMPSPHAEGARNLIEKIRALRAEIPRLTLILAQDDGRRLSARNSVPDSVIESASVAVQTSPRLENVAGMDATTLRDSYGFAISYDAVVMELESLTRTVAHSIRLERAQAAAAALDVYAVARRLSRQKDGAELLPHVEDMRKKLNKGRTRKSNSNPDPAPALTSTPSKKV